MSTEKHQPQLFLPLLEQYRADSSFFSNRVFGNLRIATEGQFSDTQLNTLFNYVKNPQYTLWEQFKFLISNLYSFKQKIGKVTEDGLEQQLIANIWASFILLQNPYTKMREEFIEFLTTLQSKVPQNSSDWQFIEVLINNTELSDVNKSQYQHLLKFLFNCSPQLMQKKTKEDIYQQIAKKMTTEEYVALIQSSFITEAMDEESIQCNIASMWEFVNATILDRVAEFSKDSQQSMQFFKIITKLCAIYEQKVKSFSVTERQNIFTLAGHKNIFAAIKFVARSECSKSKLEFDKIQQQINEFKLPASIEKNIFLLTGSCPKKHSKYSREIAEIEKEVELIKKNHEVESKKIEKSRAILEAQLQDGREHLCLEQFAPKMLKEIATGLTYAQQQWKNFNDKVTKLETRINNRVTKLKQENQTAYHALKTEYITSLSDDKSKAEQTTQAISTLKTIVPTINQIINDAKLTDPLAQKNIEIVLTNIDTLVKNKEEQKAKRIELETAILKEFDDLAELLVDENLTLKVRAEKITALSTRLPEFKQQICQPTDQIEQALKNAQTKLGEETSIIIQQLKTQINAKKIEEEKISEAKSANETEQQGDKRKYSALNGAIGLLRGEVQAIDQEIAQMLTQKGAEAQKTFSDLSKTTWVEINQQKEFIQQVETKISTINTHIDLMKQYLWWTIVVLFIFETVFRDFFEFEFIKEHKDIRDIHDILDQKKELLSTKQKNLEEQQTKLETLDKQIEDLINVWDTIESQLKVVQGELTLREKTELALKTQLTLINFDAENYLATKLPPVSAAQHTVFFPEVSNPGGSTNLQSILIPVLN